MSAPCYMPKAWKKKTLSGGSRTSISHCMEYPQGYFRQVIGLTMLLQLEKRVDALEQGAGIGEARAGI